jgi:hypothetical protein
MCLNLCSIPPTVFFPWAVIWEDPAKSSQRNCNFVYFTSLVVPNHTNTNHETNPCQTGLCSLSLHISMYYTTLTLLTLI